MTVKWETYDATRVDNKTLGDLVHTALHSMQRDPEVATTYATTGDTLVIAMRGDDGDIRLLECLVRREAEVVEVPT